MPAQSSAQSLLQKAEKKFNSSGGWFSSSSAKYEEAGDLYQQAANAFKLEKLFRESGDCFAKEAECREKCNEINDAANAWWFSAKSYKNGFPDLAITALGQTVTYLTRAGRFRQAADREKEIAQLYLRDLRDIAKACESYERAAEWYEQEDAQATANGCYKDAADLRADLDNFNEAIALYEKVADHSLTSPLTRYSVKEYWLKASLCGLAAKDPGLVKRNLARYASLDTSFPSTREAKFVTALLEAINAGDLDQYTAVVGDYDQVTPLDNWKTGILLKIKKSIDEEPDLR